MKLWVALASAFLMLSACGSSKEAKDALTAMKLDQGGHGWVQYDSQSGWGGKMTFKGVRIRLGEGDQAPRVKIDSLVFDGLKMAGDSAVFSEMTLTGVTPELPKDALPLGLALHVDKLVLKKPNEDMAKTVAKTFEWLGDPQGEPPGEPDPETWTFGQLLLGGLSLKGRLDEEGTTGDVDFKVGEVSLTDARSLRSSDPSFGKFLISGVALKADNVKDQNGGFSGKGEIGLGEFSITDLKQVTAQKQEIGKIQLLNYSTKVDGSDNQNKIVGEVGLREISLTDLKQMSMEGQAFGRFAIAGFALKGDGEFEGKKAHVDASLGELSLSGLNANLAGAKIDFDKFLLSNVATNVNVEGDTPGRASFALGELSGSGMRDLKLGAFVLAGLKADFDAPDEASQAASADNKARRIKGSVDFGALNISNLDVGLCNRLAEAGRLERVDPEMSGKASADALRSLSSPIESCYDSLVWTGMNADVGGFKLSSTKIESKTERDAKGVATRLVTPAASLAFSVDPAGSEQAKQVSEEMAELGLKNVELHFGSDAKYDPAQDVTRFTNLNIGSSGLAELTIGGGAKGLTRGMAAAIEMLAMEGKPDPLLKTDFDNMQVIDFDLALTDQKLLELIFASMARKQGGDATAAKIRADAAEHVLALKADMQKAGMEPALAGDIASALAGFVQKPGTLRIRLAPPRPVPMRMLGDKGVSKSALGFSATFTPTP